MGEARLEDAIFGAGCFWGVEMAFRSLPGVRDTAVGYCGGATDSPTYADVCGGRTGHAEVVLVRHDPAVAPYGDLLAVFWGCHDPTQGDRQGPDVGSQYRSVIFYATEAQRAAALASRAAQAASGRWPRPITTAVERAMPFWRAEEWHQRYLERRGAR